MNYLMMRMLGMHLMNEAGADAGSSAPAAPAAPAAEPAAAAQPAAAPAQPTSLLGTDPAAAPAQPAADPTDPAAAKPDAEVKPDAAIPERYEFKLPEGEQLDEKALPMVEGLFKELGLPQDKAQAVLDKLLEIDQARQPTLEQVQQAQLQAITKLNEDWGKQCRELPEIGGENYDASLKTCLNVITRFATPELREVLTYSGLGSNPHFFKFIHAIGSSMSEDTFVHGGAPGQGPKSIEQRLWPKN